VSGFAERLLAWFDDHGRHDLPWQHPRTPYRVWLSEIMLQQTQVQTAAPYFERFTQALPELKDLAIAPIDRVLALWAGLGYYARARNLHRAAALCVEQHEGRLPESLEALVALPGIGRSTAGAILAQAHGHRVAILDGNVKRVLARVHGVAGWPGTPAVEKRLWALSELHLPDERLADYTQAIMDLGATLCTRRNPHCIRCPFAGSCDAHQNARTDELPTPRPTRNTPQRDTVMLVLRDAQGRVLLQRRPETGIWGGLWSLPEAADTAAARVLAAHHSDADGIDGARTLEPFNHVFSHFRLQVQPLLIEVGAARGRVGDNDDLRWHPPAEARTLGMPAPIARLLKRINKESC
jgi:A/G-specific adenine glycosylase